MAWDKKDFTYSGEYLHYRGQFVARFKYSAQKRRKAAFMKFLMQNFTPEEYFAEREAGEAPLMILIKKGF